MIITFKEAPELGRLKVVSDRGVPVSLSVSCFRCAFIGTNKCVIPVRAKLNCSTQDIYFEQVKQND